MEKQLLNELYEDLDINQSTSTDNFTENHSYRIDAETGIVEPIYLDNDEDLRGYTMPVLEEIREYFKERMGIEVDYFGDVKIRFAKLAPARKSIDGKAIEKVFGFYDPETNVIYVDEILNPENQSEEKELLQQYMELPSLERVLGEEFIHYVQKKTGSIKELSRKYGDIARDYIEGSAATIADEIFGETKIYGREKSAYRRLVDKYGERDALLGIPNIDLI